MPNSERWIEIDLAAIRHNYLQLREWLPKNVAICAVVKADAYGHGLVEVAQVLAKEQVPMLAVTTLDEARLLRQNKIATPILVFAPLRPELCDTAIELDVIPTIDSIDGLKAWQQKLPETGKKPFDLKVDTGMGRMGVLPCDALSLVEQSMQYKNIYLRGVYSHLAQASNPGNRHTRQQIDSFGNVVAQLASVYPERFVAHIAASAGVMYWPGIHGEMGRLGTLLYGQKPANVLPDLNLQDPWQVKARLITVKHLPAGASVGYGSEYTTARGCKVGVLPLGYADGFGLNLQVRRQTLGHIMKQSGKSLSYWLKREPIYAAYSEAGQRLPVLGRIAMQTAVLNLNKTDLQAGDIVKINLRRTMANPLLTRVFIDGGKEVRKRYMGQEGH